MAHEQLINHLQLKNFPEYDNTELFIELLDLLTPQGFTDNSWRNDEWPSMINDNYCIHISYSAEYELNDCNEVCIALDHLDEESCTTDESATFETIEGLTKYLMAQKQFRKAKFQIDDGDIFEGWTRGETWNGWAMPYFEQKEALKLAEVVSNHDYRLKQSECEEYFAYIDPDYDFQVFEACVALPMKIWGIGAGSWCWDEVTEEEKGDTPAPSVPINKRQLETFTEYDNTALFVEILELLAPQGFTDSSYRNDEWPSMINSKFVIHVSYTAESDDNYFNEVCIGVIHLDEEGCTTDKCVALKTVEELTKYLESQKVTK